MNIHKRIAEARHQLRLNQREFAEGICISKAYLSALELGRRNVNDRIIKLISITYGVSELWLQKEEGTILHDTADWKLEQMVGLFKKLELDMQNYALKQLDSTLVFQDREREQARSRSSLSQ